MQGPATRGFGGDGGPATNAPLNGAGGVAVDNAGNVFIAEYENRIRRVDAATGVITTIAGTGAEGFGGDGGPATARAHPPPARARRSPAAFELFVADTENDRLRSHRPPDGTITTVAGTGEEGFGGDGGPAVRAPSASRSTSPPGRTTRCTSSTTRGYGGSAATV